MNLAPFFLCCFLASPPAAFPTDVGSSGNMSMFTLLCVFLALACYRQFMNASMSLKSVWFDSQYNMRKVSSGASVNNVSRLAYRGFCIRMKEEDSSLCDTFTLLFPRVLTVSLSISNTPRSAENTTQ